MGDFVFNVGKGRVAELYNRVDLGDPAAAELVIMILAASGLESDAVLKRKTTFADVVSGATNEVTNSGYAKKVLNGSALAAYAADQSNDRVDLDLPDQTWAAVAAGDGWAALIIGYDPVGSQTMSDIIPLTCHAFVVTPDGSDILAQFAAAGFFRAS